MTVKAKVYNPHFPYQLRESQDTYLVIVAQIHFKLPRGQAEFPRILSQNGQNDHEGQGQWPPFSIPTESIPGCMFGTNLVLLAQICVELSCRQGKAYEQMDEWTDTGNDNTPSVWKAKGKNHWYFDAVHFKNIWLKSQTSEFISNLTSAFLYNLVF